MQADRSAFEDRCLEIKHNISNEKRKLKSSTQERKALIEQLKKPLPDDLKKQQLTEQIEEHSAQIGEHQTRIADLQAKLKHLEGEQTNQLWLAESLQNFDAIWQHMTAINRNRLIALLVKDVRLDERNDAITVTLAKLASNIP